MEGGENSVEQNMTLHDLVYQEIVMDIYMGKLRNGDKLPTLVEFCEKYNVGRNTARAVLQTLIDYGYVKRTSKKQIRVCFHFDDGIKRQKYLSDLVRRREAILDVYEIIALIMPDITEFCLDIGTEKERYRLAELCDQAVSKDVQSELHLFLKMFDVYRYVMQISCNHLLISLFEAMYQFIMLPLTSIERNSPKIKTVLPMIRMFLKGFKRFILYQNYKILKQQLLQFIVYASKQSDEYLQRISGGISDDPKVQFMWYARSGQEFLYTSIVLEILSQILSHKYVNNDLLPSYAELAVQYHVSEKTTRKAIAILDKMGIVRISNGRRTMITTDCVKIPTLLVEDPQINQNMVTCIEAIQIMALICKPMIVRAFEKSFDCDEKFIQMVKREEHLPVDSILDPFVEVIDSCALRAIYCRLKRTLHWICIFDFFEQKENRFVSDDQLTHLLDQIGKKEKTAFVEELQELYVCIFNELKDYGQRIGLQIKTEMYYSKQDEKTKRKSISECPFTKKG